MSPTRSARNALSIAARCKSRINRAAALLAFPIVVLTNSLLLWYFHNRFWFPTDEGNYAHVAQRMLSGQVLNLQVQDHHAGYINFVNAAAMQSFGLDFVSMRYPLVLISLIQSCLIFFLFRRRSYPVAVAVSIAMTALGVIQFLNPSASWYCLFLLILIICCLQWLPRGNRFRVMIVGFLVVTLTLFRQLSGVFVAMGVLTYFLIESSSSASARQVALERVLVSVMTGGLALYLLYSTDIYGFLLFGVWPLGILAWLWLYSSTGNGDALRIVSHLSLGGLIGVLPLLLYHLSHNSLVSWFDDVVLSALVHTKLEYLKQPLYGSLVLKGLHQLVHPANLRRVFDGLYWVILSLLAVANGLLVLRLLRQQKLKPPCQALPILAVFGSLAALIFQIPAYLYYTVGLSLASILWIASSGSAWLRRCLVLLVVVLSIVGIVFHAAQPQYPRTGGTVSDILSGVRGVPTFSDIFQSRMTPTNTLARCSLVIEPDDRTQYIDLVRFIQRETRPDEKIFAVPSKPQLYFLSERGNPFRFYNTALGIRNSNALKEVLDHIVSHPPKLVIFDPKDHYITEDAVEIMKLVRQRYDFLGTVSQLEMYRSREWKATQASKWRPRGWILNVFVERGDRRSIDIDHLVYRRGDEAKTAPPGSD